MLIKTADRLYLLLDKSDNMLKIREARHPSQAAGDRTRDEL